MGSVPHRRPTEGDRAGSEARYERYERIFDGVDGPFAFVDLDALRTNADVMLRMADDKPIRVASKSVRSVPMLRRILELHAGFRGILAFTLPEALFLAERGFADVVVAYPTLDRGAIAELAELVRSSGRRAPVPMVDSTAHLDLLGAGRRRDSLPLRVCLEVDAGWSPLGGRLARIGPKRSPVRTEQQARLLAAEIARRRGLELAGVMAYEGHIAGVGDHVPGRPVRNAAIRWMQVAADRDIRRRLPAVVAAVRETAELEFVNGGGTGSLARTSAAGVATELSAGSGFYAPALFDQYRSLALTPAAFFVIPVTRLPAPGVATALGGGYVASGPARFDRLPRPYLPDGLRLDRQEGAGEVQTPLCGPGARRLRAGDRVYMRHAKAGELCERFASLYLVEGDRIADEVPTYRGDGRTFL